MKKERESGGLLRALGLGLITGAADDDPSAIGTYAAAGAKLGPGRFINGLGWLTRGAIFAATAGLVYTWIQ
jgi:hypothetical protein